MPPQNKPADLLQTCSPGPDCLYRLPFSPGGGWSLTKGNWDDPSKKVHDTKDGGAQSYSYDFVHKKGVGQWIRAARSGRVVFVKRDQSANTTDSKPDPPGTRGEGNLVVIRHVDGTAAAYAHLKKNTVVVNAGEYVPRGRIIGQLGNTGSSFGPHLHFDVHPSFTDWDNWVPTMKIRFEDCGHTCWRPNVGDELASNNTVSCSSFAALIGPGGGISTNDSQSFLAGLEFDDFVAAWVDLGTTATFQDMKSFRTHVEGGKRRFAGLFGPGKGGQHFVAGLEFQPFVDKWVELGKKSPKADMLAFDTYVEGGKRRFAGLFGPPGKGGQHFVAGLEFQPFVDKWVELGKKSPKKDMITFRAYTEGGKTRFAGLFGPGKGGQHFVAGLEFQPFVDKWVELGTKTPKSDMLAFDVYAAGGKTRFAGLFGPGKGGQEFYAGIDFDTLANKWVKAKSEGRRLICVVPG